MNQVIFKSALINGSRRKYNGTFREEGNSVIKAFTKNGKMAKTKTKHS